MICAAHGENAVSHTTCKTCYQKFRQGDFSFADELHAGCPQKIETDELQAWLDINSAQIEKELAEQLKITQQAISVRLHIMGKIQKEGRWVPHELSEDNKNRRHDTTLTLFPKFREKTFCTKSLQAMKSVFFMITLNVENDGLTLVNLRHERQSLISTPRRFFSVSGGIEKMCRITSCYNRVI